MNRHGNSGRKARLANCTSMKWLISFSGGMVQPDHFSRRRSSWYSLSRPNAGSNKATGIIGTGIEINGWRPSAGSCFIFPYIFPSLLLGATKWWLATLLIIRQRPCFLSLALSLFPVFSSFSIQKSDTTATVLQRHDIARCSGLILQKERTFKYSLAAASFHTFVSVLWHFEGLLLIYYQRFSIIAIGF